MASHRDGPASPVTAKGGRLIGRQPTPPSGANIVVRAHREACLDLADRIGLTHSVIHSTGLLVYWVLGRGRAIITGRVSAVLGSLELAHPTVPDRRCTLQTATLWRACSTGPPNPCQPLDRCTPSRG